jgi:hypothetical protein
MIQLIIRVHTVHQRIRGTFSTQLQLSHLENVFSPKYNSSIFLNLECVDFVLKTAVGILSHCSWQIYDSHLLLQDDRVELLPAAAGEFLGFSIFPHNARNQFFYDC